MSEELDPAIEALLADLTSDETANPTLGEWPDSKALCCHYGAVMKNLPAYRQDMAASGIVELAYEFAVMDHVVRLLDVTDDPVAKLACPAMARLRDICAAEGIRRGIVLTAGDDIAAISLAVDLVEEMVDACGLPFAPRGPR